MNDIRYVHFHNAPMAAMSALALRHLFDLCAAKNPEAYQDNPRCLPVSSRAAVSADTDGSVRMNYASPAIVRVITGNMPEIEALLEEAGRPGRRRKTDFERILFESLKTAAVNHLDRVRGAECESTADLRAMARDSVHIAAKL